MLPPNAVYFRCVLQSPPPQSAVSLSRQCGLVLNIRLPCDRDLGRPYGQQHLLLSAAATNNIIDITVHILVTGHLDSKTHLLLRLTTQLCGRVMRNPLCEAACQQAVVHHLTQTAKVLVGKHGEATSLSGRHQSKLLQRQHCSRLLATMESFVIEQTWRVLLAWQISRLATQNISCRQHIIRRAMLQGNEAVLITQHMCTSTVHPCGSQHGARAGQPELLLSQFDNSHSKGSTHRLYNNGSTTTVNV